MTANDPTANSRKRRLSEDVDRLPLKLHRSESKRSITHPTRFNDLSNNTLLRDVEDLSVVWLDGNINQREDCIDTELELRRLTASLKTFTDLHDCVNYLTNLPSKQNRVFLIVSGILGIALLECVQNLEAIVWIYVFCENEALHTEWAKQYGKVRGVFVEKTPLFSRLLSDIATLSVQMTPMRIFQSDDNQKSVQDLSAETASFMWSQLLIRIILTMCDNRDDRAKKDMINACLKRYEGDTCEKNRIKDFEENYRTGQAIQWYTKDSFLYRSVNRAFRTADIDIIYQFRFIIAEIHDQLASLPRPSASDLVVYRGQIISDADMKIIEANEKKSFISMNTFLSTSEIANHAIGFSAVGIDLPEGLHSVLFQISVGHTRQPFANIDTLSAMPTEKEILFSAGTVFRIDEVEKHDSGTVVSLTLTTEVEQRFDALVDHFMSEIGQSPTLAMFGRFLILQGDYNRAERYFQFLVDENGPDLDDIGRDVCYTNLGYILGEKGEYERAMDYYQQVLSIQKRILEEGHPHFAKTYNNIGTIYMDLGQYTEAAKNFQLSLSIDLLCEPQNEREISKSYSNLGQAYLEMGDYINAKTNFEKALEKEEELGFDTIKHPDVAITYHNMGSLHDEMKQYTKAIEYYKKALMIQEVSLPLQHPSRIKTESCLSMAYSQLGDDKAALEKCLVVLDAKLAMRPSNFPSLAKTYINLGTIYRRLGDFISAEVQLNKALQISIRHLPKDHPDQGAYYQSLGDLYDAMGKTKKARSSYEQALAVWQHQELPNLTSIGKAYANLSSVEDDPVKAIEYAKQGLASLLSVDLIDKKTLAATYSILGNAYQNAKQLEEAIANYTLALDLAREFVNGDDNDPSLSTFYNNLGSAYGREGNFEKALEYMHTAHDNQLKVRDPYHSDMGEIYNNLGLFYSKMENYDQAVEFLQKAIDVYKQPNAQNLRLLANTYESMGFVYDSSSDWKKAVDYYKIALQLQLDEPESNESDLVSTYLSLATVYEERDDYETALSYLIPMLKIQEKILSSSDLELADDYDRVGTCYFFNKQAQLAIKHYEKVVVIRCQQKAPLASVYQALADAYSDLGELDTASDHYEMAINSLMQGKEEERSVDYYVDLCLLYKDLGVVQQRLNLFDKAMGSFNRSLDLCNEFLAQNSERDDIHCQILESTAKLHEAAGNTRMAEECRAKKNVINTNDVLK